MNGRRGGGPAEQARQVADEHLSLQHRQLVALDTIARQIGATPDQLCVTDADNQPGLEIDFPIEGTRRWVEPRTAAGGSFATGAAAADILAANNRRLGGRIQNAGAQAIDLYLAKAARVLGGGGGIGRVYLAANGGTWDFLLGSLLWAGSISALSAGGASTLYVVEV